MTADSRPHTRHPQPIPRLMKPSIQASAFAFLNSGSNHQHNSKAPRQRQPDAIVSEANNATPTAPSRNPHPRNLRNPHTHLLILPDPSRAPKAPRLTASRIRASPTRSRRLLGLPARKHRRSRRVTVHPGTDAGAGQYAHGRREREPGSVPRRAARVRRRQESQDGRGGRSEE